MNFYNLQVDSRYSPKCRQYNTWIGYDNIHLLYCDRQLCVCMHFLQMGIYPITIQTQAIYSSIFMYLQTESIRFLEKNDIHTKKYIKNTFDPATVWHFICDFMPTAYSTYNFRLDLCKQYLKCLGYLGIPGGIPLAPSLTNGYRLYPINEWKYCCTCIYRQAM